MSHHITTKRPKLRDILQYCCKWIASVQTSLLHIFLQVRIHKIAALFLVSKFDVSPHSFDCLCVRASNRIDKILIVVDCLARKVGISLHARQLLDIIGVPGLIHCWMSGIRVLTKRSGTMKDSFVSRGFVPLFWQHRVGIVLTTSKQRFVNLHSQTKTSSHYVERANCKPCKESCSNQWQRYFAFQVHRI